MEKQTCVNCARFAEDCPVGRGRPEDPFFDMPIDEDFVPCEGNDFVPREN